MAQPQEKNPAAVALGRLGGLKGGKARAAKLTPAKPQGDCEKGRCEAVGSHWLTVVGRSFRVFGRILAVGNIYVEIEILLYGVAWIEVLVIVGHVTDDLK